MYQAVGTYGPFVRIQIAQNEYVIMKQMYPAVGTQRVALDRDSMGLRVNARNDTNA